MDKHIDKNSIKHFGVNFLLTLFGGIFGIGMGIGASLTKEWTDKQYYGHWCWYDLGFDLLGTTINKGLQQLILKQIVY